MHAHAQPRQLAQSQASHAAPCNGERVSRGGMLFATSRCIPRGRARGLIDLTTVAAAGFGRVARKPWKSIVECASEDEARNSGLTDGAA